MKKIEAVSLEEAYAIACEELGCSMSELKYEIVQYPSKGVFGLFAKPAIIVADTRRDTLPEPASVSKPEANEPRATERREEAEALQATHESQPQGQKETRQTNAGFQRAETPEEEGRSTKKENGETSSRSEEEILDGFFNGRSDTPEEAEVPTESGKHEDLETRNLRLQQEIEETLKELMAQSCFDIDVVEVDVIDRTAYIFIDGEDAALIIGKEGYRYNALSYLLYNWIHSRYDLYVKLEIARFLSSQEEMIRNGLQPVIEHIEREGWGRTRPLDGILVQIALEQLRERFPDKYVAVKRQRDGKRYILVNPFNSRK
ncbi:Jag N-terminal domain-containing protein [Nitratifractor sp.]|uniref:Jag N-terminal domain-containing protein n=1 Tax=Nitratifractor sp. TaxID=2268144 RepID=UPI0025CDF751|nr:Jag N-terminal domain-containing protein [Nitratifractor sp.]